MRIHPPVLSAASTAYAGGVSHPTDSTSKSAPQPTRSPEQEKALKRAAAPRNPGKAMARMLRDMLSSKAAEVSELKDATKEALRAYNADSSPRNRQRFLDAFVDLRGAAPPAEIASVNPSWGQMENPDNKAFFKRIRKLNQAYDILKAEG